MTKLIGTAPNQTPTNADLGRLAYQDAIANGTGTAGQLLQSGGATGSPAWATVSTSADAVVFPNLASPNNTYASSGTWSKGSLADDAYVWLYLVGGGGGGGKNATASNSDGNKYAQGGRGGNAKLLYGKAKFFHGAAYIIGAGAAGNTGDYAQTASTPSKLTLTASFGGLVFETTELANSIFSYVDSGVVIQGTTGVEAVGTPANVFTVPTVVITGWAGSNSGSSQYNWSSGVGGYNVHGANSVFGGGSGGGQHAAIGYGHGGSLYAGTGGAAQATGVVGTAPGGGGGGSLTVNQNGSAGGNGNLRQYNV